MSKSSNALLSGLYGGAMRNAAPILFCTAVVLFLGTVVTYWVLYRIPMGDDDPSTGANIYFFLEGLISAAKNSALIFTGAALVHAIQKKSAGGMTK